MSFGHVMSCGYSNITKNMWVVLYRICIVYEMADISKVIVFNVVVYKYKEYSKSFLNDIICRCVLNRHETIKLFILPIMLCSNSPQIAYYFF